MNATQQNIDMLQAKDTLAANNASAVERSHQMIAEAAYFKAEKRGFLPGFEQLDWEEAEEEIQRGAPRM